MVKQIIFCVLIIVFVIIFYNYSVNYITGKLELEWLEHGIETNWNLRFIIILCVIGGFAGFGLSKLLKRLKKK
jgi:uncharacterized membrane protein